MTSPAIPFSDLATTPYVSALIHTIQAAAIQSADLVTTPAVYYLMTSDDPLTTPYVIISGDHAHLPETPRSMARRLVKGLSPVRASIVRRKLVMHEVMVSEVNKFHRCNSSAFLTHSVIGGRIVKIYRHAQALGCKTGLNRRRLGNTSDKSALRPRRQRNLSARTALMKKVVSFMEPDVLYCSQHLLVSNEMMVF